MEVQGGGFKQSNKYDLQNLNPKTGPEQSNVSVMAHARAYLPFSDNSPFPEGETPGLLENSLSGMESRGALEGAFNTKVE